MAPGIDFAYIGPATLFGRVWEDVSGDGLRSAEEAALQVTISLLDDQGATIESQVTDLEGTFDFTGLLPGDYRLVVDVASLPVAYVPTYDSDGLTTPDEIAISLAGGDTIYAQDFSYGPRALVEGPAAHWTFDEGIGDTAFDRAGNDHTAVFMGAPTWKDGLLHGALTLDGQDDSLLVAPSTWLEAPAAFSIAAWVQHGAAGGWRSIVDKRDAGADGYDLYLEPSGSLFMRVDSETLPGSSLVADGLWHHVAGIYDGSEIVLYVDGAQDAAVAAPGLSPNPVADLLIGENYAGNNSFFAGSLDDLRIYDRALTAAEIVQLFEWSGDPDDTPPVRAEGAPEGVLPIGTASVEISLRTGEAADCRHDTEAGKPFGLMAGVFTSQDQRLHSDTVSGLLDGQIYRYFVRCRDLAGNTNDDDFLIELEVDEPIDLSVGLVGYWALDDGAGAVASDGSASGYQGTVFGGAAWGPGRVGGGLTFDGIDDSVQVSAATALDGPSAFTLAAWIHHPAASGWHSIVDKRDSGADGYDLYINGTSRLFFRVNQRTLNGSTVVADGSWHHVLAVYDGSAMRLYVDGAADGSPLTVGALTLDTAASLLLGENYALGNSFFAGTLDEVRAYDRALSEDEIQALFDFGTTP